MFSRINEAGTKSNSNEGENSDALKGNAEITSLCQVRIFIGPSPC